MQEHRYANESGEMYIKYAEEMWCRDYSGEVVFNCLRIIDKYLEEKFGDVHELFFLKMRENQ